MCDKNQLEAVAQLAKLFHETYERLAVECDWQTQKSCQVPWDELPENNKTLMLAVCSELTEHYPNALPTAPIPMVLHCPSCRIQHIDKPEPENNWDNPRHKSHLCSACGTIWRPADVPTVGVADTETHGEADNIALPTSP